MRAGVDGAGGDYLAAVYDDGYSYRLFGSFEELWDELSGADPILVDVPIGLRNDGEPRDCDTEARRRVRRGVVFPTPSRPAVYEDVYEAAKETNERVTGGKSLSRQTWNICPLIREVDEFLDDRREAHGTVRESHPELCLWSLNGGETVGSSKKTDDGYEERVAVLERHEPRAREALADATDALSDEPGVARDDVVDALALAVSAGYETETVPEDPPADGRGLRVSITYPRP